MIEDKTAQMQLRRQARRVHIVSILTATFLTLLNFYF